MPDPSSYLDAVRAAYDTVAFDYAELLRTALAVKPLDRAVLGAFAEFVLADSGSSVADIGCGPGRVTAYLHSLGVPVFGLLRQPEPPEPTPQTYLMARSGLARTSADGG